MSLAFVREIFSISLISNLEFVPAPLCAIGAARIIQRQELARVYYDRTFSFFKKK
jgi:hypothetical protein